MQTQILRGGWRKQALFLFLSLSQGLFLHDDFCSWLIPVWRTSAWGADCCPLLFCHWELDFLLTLPGTSCYSAVNSWMKDQLMIAMWHEAGPLTFLYSLSCNERGHQDGVHVALLSLHLVSCLNICGQTTLSKCSSTAADVRFLFFPQVSCPPSSVCTCHAFCAMHLNISAVY